MSTTDSKNPQLSSVFERLAATPTYHGRKPKTVHDRGQDDNTPLHTAVLSFDLDAGKVLLEAGANPNAPGEHSNTPLHTAIEKRNYEFVQLLLTHAASKELKNGAGLSSTDLVEQSDDNQLKSVFSSWPKNQLTPEAAAILQEMEKGEYPDLLEIKLSDVNARGVLGDTPLHLAATWGDTKIGRVLLEAGANPNLLGEYDNTPLHNAVRGGKYDFVKLLLEHGASKDVRNEDGFTAVDYAEKSGDTLLIERFRDKRQKE